MNLKFAMVFFDRGDVFSEGDVLHTSPAYLPDVRMIFEILTVACWWLDKLYMLGMCSFSLHFCSASSIKATRIMT